MNEKEQQKRLWRRRWLICMNELTSLELQKKSWLDRTTENPHWSFVEFMCSYFDDLSIDDNYRHQLKVNWISLEEFKIIEKWHQLLDEYEAPDGNNDEHKSILEDKQWLMTIDIGQKTKNELGKLLNDEERSLLLEEIEYP